MKRCFYYFCTVTLMALVTAGCATTDKTDSIAQELARLDHLATSVLNLDLGKVERKGAYKNMVGIRSQDVLFSKRVDSRTYFIQDNRYQASKSTSFFQGPDKELVSLSHKIMHELAIPMNEISNSVVMTEKMQTARYDRDRKKLIPGEVRTGRRFVEVSRAIDGVPVFSSRALIGLAQDKSVGFLEVHWPQLSKRTLREGRRLREIVQKGWKPPSLKGAVVESFEAGIIHSPAIGFVMDVYPAIRVIYTSKDKAVGRKAVLYLNESGKSMPVPRTFEKVRETPTEKRRANYKN